MHSARGRGPRITPYSLYCALCEAHNCLLEMRAFGGFARTHLDYISVVTNLAGQELPDGTGQAMLD